jgi:hypothetical protein
MSKKKNKISKKFLRQMKASGMEERKRIRAMTEYPFFLGRLHHQLEDWYLSGFSQEVDHEIILTSTELNEENKRRWKAFHKLCTALRIVHHISENLLHELEAFDGDLYLKDPITKTRDPEKTEDAGK